MNTNQSGRVQRPFFFGGASMLVAAFCITSASLCGCGGGGGGHHSTDTSAGATNVQRGSLTLSVTWPTSNSRLIPAAAQSLKVTVRSGANVVGSQVVVRPTASATFSQLPVGPVSVVVEAFASTNGTGTPLASATQSATINDGQNTPVSITLASTIDHLTVSPTPFNVVSGQTQQIVATGVDANGNPVLLSSGALVFSSSNPAVASVDANGLVTGNAAGTATITVTDTESGKTLTFTVSSLIGVSISPSNPFIGVGTSQQFTATVTGTSNTAVTWTIQEGAAGGSVSASGLYTAPSNPGTYHLTATSAADPSRQVTILVSIGSGSMNVTVN